MFVVEAYRDDYRSWRHVDEFRTQEEANARMAKLELILRMSLEEPE